MSGEEEQWGVEPTRWRVATEDRIGRAVTLFLGPEGERLFRVVHPRHEGYALGRDGAWHQEPKWASELEDEGYPAFCERMRFPSLRSAVHAARQSHTDLTPPPSEPE